MDDAFAFNSAGAEDLMRHHPAQTPKNVLTVRWTDESGEPRAYQITHTPVRTGSRDGTAEAAIERLAIIAVDLHREVRALRFEVEQMKGRAR